MDRVFFCTLLIILPIFNAHSDVAQIIAPSATESIMTFTATVTLEKNQTPDEKTMNEAIHKQNEFLLSQLESVEHAEMIGAEPLPYDLGVIGLGQILDVEILKTIPVHEKRWQVTYRLKQKVVVAKSFLKPEQTKDIQFFIPQYPKEIYVKERTDEKWKQRKFFYYYWQPPYDPADRSQYVGVDQVDLVDAQITGLKKIQSTRAPNYERLWAQAMRDGEFHISLLLGFDESIKDKSDNGRVSYEEIREGLLQNGFQIFREKKHIYGPYVDFVKRSGVKGVPDMYVSLSLSASDSNMPVHFAKRARFALEHNAILNYNGHSGLGGNLDIDRIAALSSPDPKNPIPIRFSNDYQILYLNSCSGYYFYSQMYNLAKRNAQNIDVITNGLAADYATQTAEILAMFNHFSNFYDQMVRFHRRGIKPKLKNWDQLLRHVEKIQDCTYLLNVEMI